MKFSYKHAYQQNANIFLHIPGVKFTHWFKSIYIIFNVFYNQLTNIKINNNCDITFFLHAF